MIERARTRAFYDAARLADVALLQQVIDDGLTVAIDERGARDGKTALRLLVSHRPERHTSRHLQGLQILLDARANVNADGGSALVESAKRDCKPCLGFLLQRGANASGPEGTEAMRVALESSAMDCAQLLVQYGADPEAALDDDAALAYRYAKMLHTERQAFLERRRQAHSRTQQQLLVALSVSGFKERGVCLIILSFFRLEDWRDAKDTSPAASACKSNHCVIC